MATVVEDDHCYFTNISGEVVEKILCEDVLSFTDICSVSESCSKLWQFCHSDSLWRYKFQTRWPDVYQKVRKKTDNGDWRENCIHGHYIFRETRRLIKELANNYYKYEYEVSENEYRKLFSPLIERELGLLLCIYELTKFISPENSEEDLTTKFYGERVCLYLNHKIMTEKWKDLLENHPCSSSAKGLETAFVYFGLWFQPELDLDVHSFAVKMNEIAELARLELAQRCNDHPAVKQPLHKIDDPLSASKWKPHECRMVLEALNHVLYDQLGYHADAGDSEMFHAPQFSFVNTVLSKRTGIPIVLSMLYAAVAYRLGVICFCVNCPAHFLLKFIEHPELDSEEAFTYIDAFNYGSMSSRSQTGVNHPKPYKPSRPPMKLSTVVERMCLNLLNVGRHRENHGRGLNYMLRNSLELLLLMNPDDLQNRMFLARVYMNLNFNLEQALSHMRIVEEKDNSYHATVETLSIYAENQIKSNSEYKLKKVLRARDDDDARKVKYKIGQIMGHVKFGYKCVIRGWDARCKAAPEWMDRMGINTLKRKHNQPFYHVLVDDGSNRYAAEENLRRRTKPSNIQHWQVGKYFNKYVPLVGYLPNDDLREEYPDDIIYDEEEKKPVVTT